ncbi:MAG: glutamate--tRNA ligase family protein, partial [Planctomycetota bacterium]
ECGDYLLLRRDGAIAYQLAVVVDDARQGVTEVIRGDDLLPSAVRQRLLCEALGLPFPQQLHLPLVVDVDGRRLSKRDGDLDLASLRQAGADPRAVVAWAAESLGLSDADGLASAAERAGDFDPARIPRTPAVLDDAAVARLHAR